MDQKELVVLDDEPIALLIVQKMVEQLYAEAKVVPFGDALEGLDYILNHEACLILLDLNMPGISGWEILDRLEEKGLDRNVLVLTSSISVEDRDKAREYKSVKGYFIKPLGKQQLKEALDRFSCVPVS